MEFYFDPTMTANHGNQELGTDTINLMDDYGCCIPVHLHGITEPPSYLAWKDGDEFVHKRELCKSGEWCQYCRCPKHPKGCTLQTCKTVRTTAHSTVCGG